MAVAAGKRHFGSFYSSNVGELIAIPEVTSLTCVSTLLHANSLLPSTAHVCHDRYEQRLTAGYVLYISHTKNDYTPPPIPVDLPVFTGRVEFGLPMKEKHFLLDVSDLRTCMYDVGHFIAYSF